MIARLLPPLLVLLSLCASAKAETELRTDPEAGNDTFSAVFDAAIGERITAVSSAVDCTLRVDEAKLTGTAKCAVALTSIRVDNDDVKSDHFRQWATNKKGDPEACAIEVEVAELRLDATPEPMKPVPFETEGRFTVCGRARDDGGREKISGTLLSLPAGSYNAARTLRIRARIEDFDRERFQIGPKWTEGWLARVQQLAPVVATDGTIEVSIFASEPAAK